MASTARYERSFGCPSPSPIRDSIRRHTPRGGKESDGGAGDWKKNASRYLILCFRSFTLRHGQFLRILYLSFIFPLSFQVVSAINFF